MSEQSSQPIKPWRSRIAAIVRHPRLQRILLVDGALPLYDCEPIVFASDSGPLAERLGVELGVSALHLGSIWGEYDVPDRVLRAAAVFVVPDADWTPPPNASWSAPPAQVSLPWPDPSLREAFDMLLAYPLDADVPLRAPWARPGFFEQAGAWFDASLAGTPWQLTAPVRQHRVWGISCVLRAPTANGEVWFKAAGGSDLFADEPAVMAALAAQYPELVPAPLAREPEQRWMVLPDLGTTLRESTQPQDWIDAVVAHGRMQVALAGQVGQLLAAGLHDRRLHVLTGQIEPLLVDPLVRELLGSDVHARLAAAAPRLHALCEQLAAYKLPATVIHGDLHSGNIALRDGRFQVFDWTDAALAHPFFDLLTFGIPDSILAGDETPKLRFRDAYLGLWQHLESAERLLEAWRLAQIIGSLHHVVSYWHIVVGMEPTSRWECADGLTDFAGELLEKLESANERE